MGVETVDHSQVLLAALIRFLSMGANLSDIIFISIVSVDLPSPSLRQATCVWIKSGPFGCALVSHSLGRLQVKAHRSGVFASLAVNLRHIRGVHVLHRLS